MKSSQHYRFHYTFIVVFIVFTARGAKASETCAALRVSEVHADMSVKRLQSDQKSNRPWPSDTKAEKNSSSGGNSYNLLRDMSGPKTPRELGWSMISLVSDRTLASNPYAITLNNAKIDCFLQSGLAVLLSDGSVSHFTMIWKVDRLKKRVAFADAFPKTFFLRDGNNMLGIKAEIQKVGSAEIFWVGFDDFNSLFVSLNGVVKDSVFERLYEHADNDDERRDISHAAFDSIAVFGRDEDFHYALEFLDRCIERKCGDKFLNLSSEVFAASEMARRLADQPASELGAPSGFSALSETDFVMGLATGKKVAISKPLISSISSRVMPNVDMPLKLERLFTERLARVIALTAKSQEDSALFKRAFDSHGDDARLLLDAIVLHVNVDSPPDAFAFASTTIDVLQKMTLAAAKVESLSRLRIAIEESEIQKDTIVDETFEAWTYAARGSNLHFYNDFKAQSSTFVPGTLFYFYNFEDDVDKLCSYTADLSDWYGLKNLAGKSANRQIKDVFDVTCRSK